jgi:hypothetical protein
LARPRSAVSRYRRRKSLDQFQVRDAALYTRVSISAQREGYSIPAQIKLLEDYAALNGIVVVSSHIDVETARKSGRTAYTQMLRYFQRHPKAAIPICVAVPVVRPARPRARKLPFRSVLEDMVEVREEHVRLIGITMRERLSLGDGSGEICIH